jgi:hypothetical protein
VRQSSVARQVLAADAIEKLVCFFGGHITTLEVPPARACPKTRLMVV